MAIKNNKKNMNDFIIKDAFKVRETDLLKNIVPEATSKIPSNVFFRSSSTCMVDLYIIKDPASYQDNLYILAPDLVDQLKMEAFLATAAYTIDQYDNHRIFIAKHPYSETDQWGLSRHEALTLSLTEWVRMKANMAENMYDISVSTANNKPSPTFPERDFTEILEEVFADRVIASMDHDLVQRLQGVAL